MSGSYGSENEPTRRIPVERDTRYQPRADEGAPRDDQYHDAWRDDRGAAGPPPGRPPRRRGRDFAMWLFGAVIGFVIAFIVVALGTSDRDADDPAATGQIEALEAELDDRDAQIADLEARLSEAEAAAGDRAEDVQAQRDALDERARALDERANVLDEREAAVDRREAAVAERERAVDEAPPTEEADDGLPGIDDDAVDSIVDRVLDQLRDLFGD